MFVWCFSANTYMIGNMVAFQWLEDDFLEYLHSWEMSVASQTHLAQSKRRKIMLSTETLEGLNLTSNCNRYRYRYRAPLFYYL